MGELYPAQLQIVLFRKGETQIVTAGITYNLSGLLVYFSSYILWVEN